MTVAPRGEEEGIGDLMRARCELAWMYLTPLLGVPGIEARKHASTLYASLFRFDDALLANPHALGIPAGHSLLLHIARIPGGRLFARTTWSRSSGPGRLQRRCEP